jgi:hypothetical protein
VTWLKRNGASAKSGTNPIAKLPSIAPKAANGLTTSAATLNVTVSASKALDSAFCLADSNARQEAIDYGNRESAHEASQLPRVISP